MGLDAWLRGMPHGDGALPALDKTLEANGREFPALAAAARRRPRPSLIRVRVFDPLSRFALFWGVATTVMDLTYTSFIVPLSIAFNSGYSITAFNVLDAIGNTLYLVDVVVEFQVGFIARWDTQRATVLDGPAAARFYIRHGTFWVDIAALVPSVVHYSLLFNDGADGGDAARVVSLVKLFRLARVFRLLGRMHRPDSGGVLGPEISARLSVTTVVVADTLLVAALLVNLMGCIWWWIAAIEGLDDSWVRTAKMPFINLRTSNNWTRWLVSVYFATLTVTTIGYGDIVPVTTAEVGCVLGFMAVGVAFFGYLLSTMATLLRGDPVSAAASEAAARRLAATEAWMTRGGLGAETRRAVRAHLLGASFAAAAARQDDTELFDALPEALQLRVTREMVGPSAAAAMLGAGEAHGAQRARGKGNDIAALAGMVMRMATMRRAAAGEPAPGADLARRLVVLVGEIARPRFLPAGGALWSAGDAAGEVFVLDEGTLELAAAAGFERLAAPVSAPALVGGAALYAEAGPALRRRQLSARAVTPCRLWALDAPALRRRLEADAPDIAAALARSYLTLLRRKAVALAAAGGGGAVRTHLAEVLAAGVVCVEEELARLEAAAAGGDPEAAAARAALARAKAAPLAPVDEASAEGPPADPAAVGLLVAPSGEFSFAG